MEGETAESRASDRRDRDDVMTSRARDRRDVVSRATGAHLSASRRPLPALPLSPQHGASASLQRHPVQQQQQQQQQRHHRDAGAIVYNDACSSPSISCC